MSLLVLAAGLPCSSAPDRALVPDSLNMIVKQRESISGGACVGGHEWLSLGANHLLISLVAVAIAVAIAVPLGLWLGHNGRGEFLAISISNIGRAVPSLALLVFFVAFVGLGAKNVILVLALLAIPPILTNTYVGVRQVDRDLVAGARGMGLTESQIVRQVELPLAIATIFAGLRTSAVTVVATATIAPIGNVQSLGTPIVEPQTYGLPGQFAAAIIVAIITLLVDVGIGALQRAVTPKGLTIAETPASSGRRRLGFMSPARTES